MLSNLVRRATIRATIRAATVAMAVAMAGTALTGPAVAQTTADQSQKTTGWYVALGDSLAAGYQPGRGDHKRGGYVGSVLDSLQTPHHRVKLRNFACSGETSTTLVKGGQCDYTSGNQLKQSRLFLQKHARTTRLVTLSIGANDVTPCLEAADTFGCVQHRLARLSTNLHRTLAAVHKAAPSARIVVTNYYNPFLALWFTDPARANQTTLLQTALNSVIGNAAKQVHGTTANVSKAFRSSNTRLVKGVPVNVRKICGWTWMCAVQDIHPNRAGYAVVARAVKAKL